MEENEKREIMLSHVTALLSTRSHSLLGEILRGHL